MSTSTPGDASASPGVSIEVLKTWLLLWRIPGLGTQRFHQLLNRFQDLSQVWSAPVQRLAEAGLPKSVCDQVQAPDWSLIEPDLQWLEQPNRAVIRICDPDYPDLLKEIPDPPPLLYVHGQVSSLQDFQLAVVGSRNPTPNGIQSARDFASELSSVGLTITSGLALGIDAAAHLGALDVSGPTVAVAATGLDRVYPARHRDLAQQICESGALVSEFPIGTRPLAGYFPRRNRIISGLSLGVLVVEAAKQSGSLVTARLAMEQGREVFAIPGSIHNPLAKGCHALIQQGAKLVESSSDILEELQSLVEFDGKTDAEAIFEPRQTEDGLEKSYQDLLEKIGFEPTSVDALVGQTGCSAQEISSMLLVLELQGYVSSSPGGCFYRVASPA